MHRPDPTADSVLDTLPRRAILVLAFVALQACAARGGSGPTGTAVGIVAPADARATLSAYRDGEWIVETRANLRTGAFALELPPGSYQLLFSSLGYLDRTEVVEVEGGGTADLGTIGLLRRGAGNVHGLVDPPTAQATVSAVVGGSAIAQASTDAAGAYLLASLPVGVYDLVVTAPGFERSAGTKGVVVEEAATTEVAAISLVAATSPPGSLSGSVLPLGIGARVTVEQGGALIASVLVDAVGAYSITDLAPGTYDVVISASTYGTDRSRAGVSVTSEQNTSVPSVTLTRPTRTVEGRVVTQDDAVPLAGVVVRVGSTQAVTDAEGRFVVADPPAGAQALRAERVFFRAADLAITVAATGSTSVPVTLVAVGEVAGIARVSGSGSPLANVQVSIGDAVGWTNASGAYRLTGVTLGAGRYSTTRAGYVGAIGAVTVLRGTPTPLDLTMVPGVAVSGLVRDAAGPISGATVSIAGQVTATAPDGTFAFAAVPAGSQTLRASADNYVSSSLAVTAPMAGVMIALAAPAKVTVTGTVRAGTPLAVVAGASVNVGGLSATTNASGVYTVLNVPVTRNTISVTASATAFQPFSGPITLAAPGPVVVDVTMLPYARVSGHVTELGSGLPLAGVQVSASDYAVTNGSGEYALDRVPATTSYCYALGDACHAVLVEAFDPTPGSNVILEFALPRHPDLTVSVRDAVTKAPIPGAWVTVVASVYTRAQATTDALGTRTFPCQAPGAPAVFAAAAGYVDTSVSVLLVSGSTTSVTLELTPL